MSEKLSSYCFYYFIAEVIISANVTFKCCLFQIETPNGEVKKAKEGQRDEKTVFAGEMREEVERLYKLRMPDDFFQFWEFCKSLRADCPQGICVILMVLYPYQHYSCMFLSYTLKKIKIPKGFL